MGFFREAELNKREIIKGVNLRVASCEKTMITLFDFEPNATMPPHRHPHEQITYIIKGELEFTLEGKTKVLKEGDGVVILANQEHGAKVLGKPAKVIDAWYPQREDYKTVK
ncbi:MAG: cupin domain-containing protein [Planctomycetes bacterium]|nr:cupin domain-containing protein [Planctomycetota bacterium]